jgi:DNA-binding NtrC family response regulator
MEPPERILSLSEQTLDLVYVVPQPLTLEADWAETRVMLARGSRYYIVVGEGLGTAGVMQAARDGAHDVIDQLDEDLRWISAIDHAANSQALWWQLYGAKAPTNEKNLVGGSKVMSALRETIARLAPIPATVLIMGESGTGKERVSEALHAASGRERFVTVNCAAIPAELMESELFGVAKGAYTGANRDRVGLVEEAAGWTLFLDEIGEMDIALQPKLLRFLETRKARRLGSTKEYSCDVRVVSATNRDLKADSESGRFRLDLYYRLSEVVIDLPPLRQRIQDIPDLVMLFMEAAAVRLGKNFETIEPELIYKFQLHSWPGNVRELKQAVDRLAIHYNGPMMRAAWWDVPVAEQNRGQAVRGTRSPFGHASTQTPPLFVGQPAPQSYGLGLPAYSAAEPRLDGAAPAYSRRRMPSRKEKYDLAKRLLEESGGDLGWVAAQLGVHPTTLYRWRKTGKV